MRISSVLLICCTLLAACTSYTATRADTSAAQTKTDGDQCFYEAKRSVAGAAADNVLIANSEARSLTLQCMQVKGYTLTKN